MKKYLYIIFAWALTMSLTSCEDDDQYSIESVIIGRAWTGDVGMNAENADRFLARLLLEVMDLVKNISITHMMENCMIFPFSMDVGRWI